MPVDLPKATFWQTPGERIDYRLDFSELLPDGDEIVGLPEVIVSPEGGPAVLEDDPFGPVKDGNAVIVWLSGGEPRSYDITARGWNSAGQSFDRTIRVVVVERLIVASHLHDPDQIGTDYEIDFANPNLLPDGDAIAESAWAVSAGSDIEIGEDEHAPSLDGTKTRVWLSGGSAGWRYADNTVTTEAGRIYVRSLRITVGEL